MRRASRAVACLAVITSLLTPPAAARADPGFSIVRADTRLRAGVYLLDAEFDLDLTEAPLQALRSGVPLYVSIDISVTRERNWWWDETVASLAQRYRLEYHALSSLYLVVNLNTGVRRSFQEVGPALQHMGRLYDFPLLDRVLIGEAWRYMGVVRVSLDLGRLPLPLVPGAYLSSDWRLASEDYQWLLK